MVVTGNLGESCPPVSSTIRVTAANHGNYGRVDGDVVGFDYVTNESRQRETVLKFTFLGPIGPFTYTVTAPDTADTYTFDGIVTDGEAESEVNSALPA